MKRYLPLAVFVLFFSGLNSQNMNKEIVGQILIDNNSEYYTFKAAVLNTLPLDINLRYEFSFFRTDPATNNVAKSSKEDFFLLKGYDKKILSSLTINHTVEDKIVLLLIIYDKDDKPLGSDRIVLEKGGKTVLNLKKPSAKGNSPDEAAAQDGVLMNGVVLNKVLTKNGRDFAKDFFQVFYNKEIKSSKNILIKEVPGLRRNTLITVEVEGVLVWQFFAQPRKEYLEQMVQISVSRVIRHIQQLKKKKDQVINY